MMKKIRWFLLLLGVLVVVIIAFQNSRTVQLEVLFFSGQYPLTLLLLGSSAASFVFGALMTGWMLRGRGRKSSANPKTAASSPAKPQSRSD